MSVTSKLILELESKEFKMVVRKEGDRYFWQSWEDKALEFIDNGSFATLLNPDGAGYIRLSAKEGQCYYTEHITFFHRTLTYWGVCEEEIKKS